MSAQPHTVTRTVIGKEAAEKLGAELFPDGYEVAKVRQSKADWYTVRAKVTLRDVVDALDATRATPRPTAEAVAAILQSGYRKLDALLQERTNVEWLIRDFLEKGVIALFAGPKGSYKSALVNDILMRVALAGLPVFLLSPEGIGLQRRLQGWLDQFAPGKSAAELPFYVRDRRLNLSAAEEMDALVAWLDEIEKEAGKPVACIALDTWSKSTSHDEDNNTQTKLLLGEIDRRLRHRGPKPATVCIVAHTGHSNQDRARGASALAADTDAEYIVSFKSECVKVTRGRFKDSPALPPLYFVPKVRMLDYQDDSGAAATSVVLMPAAAPPGKALTDAQIEIRDQVETLIKQGLPATEAAVLEGLDGRKPDLRRRLAALVRMNVLTYSGTAYAIYEHAPIIETDEGWVKNED